MRLLITGASGQLGGYLLRQLSRTGDRPFAWSGSRRGTIFEANLEPVDLTRRDEVADAFRRARPDVIIHAAALSRVADCYQQPERARQVNAAGTTPLAELAAEADCRLVFVSTDLVFDGERGAYREEDEPAPLSIYGQTKRAAEQAVLATPRSLVVRVSLLFGPSVVDRPSFFDQQVTALRQRQPIRLFEDEWRTPISLVTAAQALIELASADCTGILHVGGPERLTRLEMGRRLAARLGADDSVLVPTRREHNPAPEPRPRDTSLDSSRWRGLFPTSPWPAWPEAMQELSSLV
jgi:dTDP-4-dehydrorhamnose reductase